MPAEVGHALEAMGMPTVDGVYGRPEHQTRLDDFGRKRQHDMLVCARHQGSTAFVIGIEAKACEGFDGTVSERAAHGPPSNKRARCNLMSRALFGRDVLDLESGEVLAPELGAHGYQLWTAAVGTLVEAQARALSTAVLLVQQFEPGEGGPSSDDRRNWGDARERNDAAFAAFAAALGRSATSHETKFVRAGTELTVAKVTSRLD